MILHWRPRDVAGSSRRRLVDRELRWSTSGPCWSYNYPESIAMFQRELFIPSRGILFGRPPWAELHFLRVYPFTPRLVLRSLTPTPRPWEAEVVQSGLICMGGRSTLYVDRWLNPRPICPSPLGCIEEGVAYPWSEHLVWSASMGRAFVFASTSFDSSTGSLVIDACTKAVVEGEGGDVPP
ncbi:hypothetical protein GW17_00044998 [Ensete ventricosum]|nr:hypothetical protein GW17_00044998 [Ensete ventricosum]